MMRNDAFIAMGLYSIPMSNQQLTTAPTEEELSFAGHFVFVHYDVSVSENAVRDSLRDELHGEGFAMQTQSVYASPYSKEALDAAEKVSKKYSVELLITTPIYPTKKQKELVRRQYETAFAKSFDLIVKQLQSVDDSLATIQCVDADKAAIRIDGVELIRKKLMNKVNRIERDIAKLENALAKRKKREPGVELEHLHTVKPVQEFP
jgi:CRISPR-associated endonuclease Cas2